MTTLTTRAGKSADGADGILRTLLRRGDGLEAGLAAWVSEDVHDPGWDAFLQRTPLGQFQQSGLWAQVKGGEGWRVIRVVLTSGEGSPKAANEAEITAGFQILYRTSRFGRIGYLTKGPVAAVEDSRVSGFLLKCVQDSIRSTRLAALILQPPDDSTGVEALLPGYGFLPERALRVISSTLVIDLKAGFEQLQKDMRRRTRQAVVQARKRGAVVREGDARDAETFFALMEATCQRQGSAPNPPSAAAVRRVLEVFGRAGCARLTLAEGPDGTMAGLLCLVFGGALSIWKKGWAGMHSPLHPNELLYHEALEWGCNRGLASADFMSLAPAMAEALRAGLPLPAETLGSRDVFNLGFGGQAKFLPRAWIHIDNPVVRMVYRVASGRALGRHFLKRLT